MFNLTTINTPINPFVECLIEKNGIGGLILPLESNIISLTTKLCERGLVCNILYITMGKKRVQRKSEKIKTPREEKKKKVENE